MKERRVQFTVSVDCGNDVRHDTFDLPHDGTDEHDPGIWFQESLDKFNRNRRPGEQSRTLLDLHIDGYFDRTPCPGCKGEPVKDCRSCDGEGCPDCGYDGARECKECSSCGYEDSFLEPTPEG